MSSQGPLHPYHLHYPDLKLLFPCDAHSQPLSLLKLLSSLGSRQIVCDSLQWGSVTVTEHVLSLSLHVSTDIVLLTGSQKC